MRIRQPRYHKNKNNAVSRQALRWTAALFLALSLTGCAGSSQGEGNDSPYVFETRFHSPEGGVEDFTVFGDSVYYSTFDNEFYLWTPGGEPQKLDIEPFQPDADSRILQADLQGNLYVFYHVPENQETAYSAANYLVKYDTMGKELAKEDISLLTRQFSPYETAVDGEGRLYLRGMGTVLQFDETCGYVGNAKAPENEEPSCLTGDAEGHVYCSLYDTQTYETSVIREIVYGREASRDDQSDSQGDSRGTSLEDNQDASPEDEHSNPPENSQDSSSENAQTASFGNPLGENMTGNYLAAYGENRFLTSEGNTLYLYDAAAKTRTALLQWANCDINPDAVGRFATLADGRIVVHLQEEDGAGELAVVSEVPRDQAARKETLTLGVLQAGNSHLLRCISRFNRNSPDCRIEIREYYDAHLDSGQPQALEDARTALHLDISSGQCPDLLVLEYDDLETYASKGLLEDLRPYLDENEELELSDNVIESYTFHGKLCALPGALQIRTLAGRTENLGQLGALGWTLEEMMDFIDGSPDSTVFSADAGQLLEYSLVFNQSHFVDLETHTCDFTSDEFIRLLEFCGRFSGKKGAEGTGVLDLMGKGNSALLHEVELCRPEDISLLMQILGGTDISYVGFPTLDGQPGSLLEDCGSTCAISAKSKHKEEAWAFLEELLTGWGNPPKSFSGLMGTKGFPTELGTRERYFAEATENPYYVREDGEVLVESGTPARAVGHSLTVNGMRAYFFVPLPEETDLICSLLDSSMTARGSSQISSIVTQEAESYFSGQKSAADVAAIIQNRVSVYLEEQD